MNKFYKTALTLLCLFACLNSYADGSKDLYPSGATGDRAFLMSSTSTASAGWPFTSLGTHYVFVNPGETVVAASSAQGIGQGQIRFTAPDGTVYSSAIGSATGQIVNRSQELLGPVVGYTPFTQVAGSSQGGLWKVELLPSGDLTQNTSNGATVAANANWTQNSTNAIAAWDISVINAASALIPGRVYATVMNMYVTNGSYYGKLFVQTSDGYTYKVNNNGQAGIGFVFFVNNKGITTGTGDAAPPSYKSLNATASIPTKDPRTADGTQSVTQKIFYTMPAADLPQSASLPGGGSTWLKVPKVIPTVSGISIDGVEGTSGQVSNKGAYIKFDANQAGTFRIILTGSGSFVTRTIIGSASAGSNSVFWDGKDGAGTAPSLGTASVTAKIQLQGAEVHFPFIDVEYNPNGTILEQLNDDGSVKSDVVYWDDSGFAGGTGASSPQFNGNSGSGISSNTNGHKWSNNYGNNRTMDTWTYILGDMVSQNTTLSIRQSDLAVQSIAPSASVTTVAAGQPISYTVSVINNGPSDVSSAPFVFKVPAGFTIGDISDVTFTSSCGTVNSPAIDGTGNYTALLDLPNGCFITFTVTGKAGAVLGGSTINMEASIMRPHDVTDPDATNPDASVPPTDPHVECLNGTSSESCNNIKYNHSVTVTPSADIVTVKSLKNGSQTSFTPGDAVVYTIVVTNNGPSDATNVNITDVAPSGTTISSWTASVTTGTVALPNASGTGDLNEIIGTLPNGAVVTYTITVQTPSSFSGNLSNTTAVTSNTPDPDATCAACTAPSIVAVPIPPATTDDATTLNANGNVTIPVLNNDNAGTNPIEPSSLTIVTQPAHGIVTVNADGTVVYTPAAGYSGPDAFTYKVQDGLGNWSNVGTVNVTVTAIPPVVTDDVTTLNANSNVTIPVLNNDNAGTNPIVPSSLTIVGQPAHGTVNVNADGTVVYTPAKGYSGPDAFTYKVQDNAGNWSNVGTVNVTVTTIPPAVTDDATTLNANGNVTIPVLNNDNAGTNPIVPSSLAIVTQPAHGIVTVNADGTVVYIPAAGYSGPDAFTYKVQDGAGNWSNVGTVNVTVTAPATTPPVVADDVMNLTSNSNVTIPVLNNDNAGTNPIVPSSLTIVGQPAHGTVNVNADGTVVYTPAKGYSGPDAFTYKVQDNAGNWSNVGTVNVTVTAPAATPPVVTNDAATLTANSNVAIPVLNNDNAGTNPIVPSSLTIVGQPAHGTVNVNADGTVVYTPAKGYSGPDAFTYKVQDNAGNWSNVGTVNVTVTAPATTPPVVADDAITLKAGENVTVPVLDNDTPGEGASPIVPSTLEIVDQPKHGTVKVNADGTVVYTPAAGYSGPDAFTYSVKDELGNLSNAAVVTVTVMPNNLDVPNVITPNGDGNNDKLVIKGLEKYSQNEIIIFNRWNNVLYKSRNYQGDWDGQGLNAGTYYYTLKVQESNGQWHTINGYLMLMR